MGGILHTLIHFFFALGGVGLLLLGILDSSFLMLPLGNDLLLVALTARHGDHMFYYVVMAALGSTLGVCLAHFVSSRTGKMALEGEKKSRQVAYVEEKVKKYGGWAIAVATLAPPGFPFTPFIVVPAALQYPLKRMAAIVAGCRLVRFLIEGWLALVYGRQILGMAKSPAVQTGVIVLVVVSLVGSVISIWGWIKRGRQKGAQPTPAPPAEGHNRTPVYRVMNLGLGHEEFLCSGEKRLRDLIVKVSVAGFLVGERIEDAET